MAATAATSTPQQKKQLLLIDGELTTVLTVEVAREVNTLDFFDRVQIPRNNVTTPILPHNTRLYRASPNYETYVIEEPPGIWMVSHAVSNGAVFQIAVPWTIFVVSVRVSDAGQTIHQPVLLFSKHRISDPNMRLTKSFLPNQHDGGVCCAGDDYARIMSSRDPLLTRLNRIVPYFKNSLFNEDIRPLAVPAALNNISTASPEVAAMDQEMFAIRFLNERSHSNLQLLSRWHLWTKIASADYSNTPAALQGICDMLAENGRPLNEYLGQ